MDLTQISEIHCRIKKNARTAGSEEVKYGSQVICRY